MRRAGAVLLGLPLLAPGAFAADPLFVGESSLQVEIRGARYSLKALVVKPGGGGKLPVALITHGSPRDNAARAKSSVHSMLPQARELAHRGWLAVAFLRRGFGESDGPFAEGYRCPAPDYRKALATAAEDIEAVRAAVAQRPDADATRVLGLGVSVGGAAMLAWAATRPQGLVGIVNVSGGTGSPSPGSNCDADALVSEFASLGERSRSPTLWLYAENDSFFPPELVRRLRSAYVKRGGQADLTVFGPVTPDGHELWSQYEGRTLWLPLLDRFLRARKLPTWDPRAIDALAWRLDPEERSVLDRYSSAPTEKALAVPRGRRGAWFSAGQDDLASARRASLERCEAATAGRCEVIAENFGAPGPER